MSEMKLTKFKKLSKIPNTLNNKKEDQLNITNLCSQKYFVSFF